MTSMTTPAEDLLRLPMPMHKRIRRKTLRMKQLRWNVPDAEELYAVSNIVDSMGLGSLNVLPFIIPGSYNHILKEVAMRNELEQRNESLQDCTPRSNWKSYGSKELARIFTLSETGIRNAESRKPKELQCLFEKPYAKDSLRFDIISAKNPRFRIILFLVTEILLPGHRGWSSCEVVRLTWESFLGTEVNWAAIFHDRFTEMCSQTMPNGDKCKSCVLPILMEIYQKKKLLSALEREGWNEIGTATIKRKRNRFKRETESLVQSFAQEKKHMPQNKRTKTTIRRTQLQDGVGGNVAIVEQQRDHQILVQSQTKLVEMEAPSLQLAIVPEYAIGLGQFTSQYQSMASTSAAPGAAQEYCGEDADFVSIHSGQEDVEDASCSSKVGSSIRNTDGMDGYSNGGASGSSSVTNVLTLKGDAMNTSTQMTSETENGLEAPLILCCTTTAQKDPPTKEELNESAYLLAMKAYKAAYQLKEFLVQHPNTFQSAEQIMHITTELNEQIFIENYARENGSSKGLMIMPLDTLQAQRGSQSNQEPV